MQLSIIIQCHNHLLRATPRLTFHTPQMVILTDPKCHPGITTIKQAETAISLGQMFLEILAGGDRWALEDEHVTHETMTRRPDLPKRQCWTLSHRILNRLQHHQLAQALVNSPLRAKSRVFSSENRAAATKIKRDSSPVLAVRLNFEHLQPAILDDHSIVMSENGNISFNFL